MNWLDIVIIAMWGIGFFVGWKMGLFGTIFTTGGLIVGVLLAARLSDNVSELITDSISSDTLATIIAYGIILVAVFAAAQVLRKVVKGILKMVFLGWVDTVGSLALGLVMGVVLSGALITVLARYSSDLPVEYLELLELAPEDIIGDMPEGVLEVLELAPGDVIGDIPKEVLGFLIERAGIQEKLNTALLESTLVPVFLDIRSAIPGHALGFVPGDFNIALDVLETQIDSQKGDGP